MKSYNHLMEPYLSPDNYRLAVKNFVKHKNLRKRKHRRARYFYNNSEYLMPEMLEYAENFTNCHHVPKVIYDGVQKKKREILVPKAPEQIVHHMVVNVLKPIFQKSMYYHSYGSIPNKGAHKGKKVIQRWIKNDPKGVKYCLKMDIKKYFNSIDHTILKDKLRKVIHDEKFLTILFEIIDVVPVGIPIGFYTSQWIANWFLTEFDHYVKEKLHVKYYIRYMDDLVMFCSNKRELHRVFNCVRVYLYNINLTVKDNWQIFLFDFKRNDNTRVGRDLDFMGFRFFRDKVILRKSIMIKCCRKVKRVYNKGRPTIYDARQIMSYSGWLSCTDTYSMFVERIKPFISFRTMRKIISKYSKKLTNRGDCKCGKYQNRPFLLPI